MVKTPRKKVIEQRNFSLSSCIVFPSSAIRVGIVDDPFVRCLVAFQNDFRLDGLSFLKSLDFALLIILATLLRSFYSRVNDLIFWFFSYVEMPGSSCVLLW